VLLLTILAELLEDMDRFYGVSEFAPAPLDERVAEIQALLFRDQPAGYVLLARDSGLAVGLASYSFLWPATGLTQSLFLKELYVREAHRGHGIGRLILRRADLVRCGELSVDPDRRDRHDTLRELECSRLVATRPV